MQAVDGTVEEPLWFGPASRPLCGWLSTPASGSLSGAVLLVPTIGREARAPRRAFRELAHLLAAEGKASLRFDYEGTGDSSREFGESDQVQAWIDSVAHAHHFLASLGVESIDAVGIRLGAALLGVSATRHELALSSMVLWDPSDSGRHYLRELAALESIRRSDYVPMDDGSIQTAEYVFSPQMADDLARVRLSGVPLAARFAARTLVIERDDRRVPSRLRTRLEHEGAEWALTTEQAAMLDVDPLEAVMPHATLRQIAQWLSKDASPPQPLLNHDLQSSALVVDDAEHAVRERFVELGERRLFGIVSEPVDGSSAPWVIMTNVANEEHIGTSRAWVELARQWSSAGFRCLRFDLSGLGDSPWALGETDHEMYDPLWLEDMSDVTAWATRDGADTIFVGMCSSAYFAIEAGLAGRSRSVSIINPPVFVDLFHSLRRLERSRVKALRAIAIRVKRYALEEWWWATVFWYMIKLLRPPQYPVVTLTALAHQGTDVYVLDEPANISPFSRTPIFRAVDIRRLATTDHCRLEFVPGLDHSMFNAEGRARTISKLKDHVLGQLPEGSSRPDAQ